MTSPVAERLLTEDEFLALPSDPGGRRRELLDGRVVFLPQPGVRHGRAARLIMFALAAFAHPARIAEVFMDVGFLIRTSPDRIVCPDVGMAALDSIPADDSKTVRGAPILAVEVRSPDDRRGEIAEKIAEYLEAGSARVWDVDPARKTVTVHRADSEPRVLSAGETLTSHDAGFDVEGFILPVADIFAPAAI